MLAVFRHNLLNCARGHVARFSFTTVITSRQHGVWGPRVCPRPEIASPQRLRTKLFSAGPRTLCLHHLRDHPSALNLTVLGQASSNQPLQPECIQIALRAKHFLLKTPNLYNCTVNLPLNSLPWSLNDRVITGALSGSKRYCTTPENQIQKAPDQDTKENEATQRAFNVTTSNEGKFKELYENPWTIPNFLCMARIVLSPVLGYLIMEQYFHLSFGLFVLAGATDLLDGYIARNWPNQKSALGSALDPLADKILISVLYISLTYAQLIPVPLTALVLARDVALIAAVFYVRYKTVPPPVTLSKFFNPCYTTAQLKPTLISKFNTAIQLFLVAASLASPIFHYTDSILLQSLWYITALTTAASGYSYYHYGRKTVEVLNNTK
ncbi:cardiolipin synthase (CMP-forming) [Hoplias malabaricus]|uniref:cardiolipin synthase (CMP-forming) n=1 Tax=Hoplias malabaricus TaxID=27720 RepID=UPI0034638076